MDLECIELCDAINEMKGLRTTYSCSGHDRDCMYVFIRFERIDDLSPLVFLLGYKVKSFGVESRWQIKLTNRTENSPVAFLLYSESRGEQAYNESKIIANVIREWLKPVGVNKEFDEKYNLTEF